MLPQYGLGQAVFAFMAVATLFLALMCVFSWLIRPIRRRPAAEETYECGIPAEGEHRGFGFQYLNYAILFLVFDLAGLYLFLYAAGNLPLAAAGSLAFAIATLCLIIVYGARRSHAA